MRDPTGLVGVDSAIATFVHAHPNSRPSDVVVYIRYLLRNRYGEFEIRKRIQWLVESEFMRYTRDWRLKTDWKPAPWMTD